MQMYHQDSNAKLCEVFEMLISRLDTIEDRLDLIILNEKHTDSLTRIESSSSFSGLLHCGRCVELRVEKLRFDVHGVFDPDDSDGLLFLTTPECPFSGRGLRNWERDPSGTTYDKDLLHIWGVDKYNEIRSRITKLHMHHTPTTLATYSTKCVEVGITSDYSDLGSALFELVLKHRVPTIVALGWSGIALKCADLKTAVQAMDLASDLFGAQLNKYILISNIALALQPLALAYLRNTDFKKQFADLDREWKNEAIEMRGGIYSGRFFDDQTDFGDQ